MKYLLLIIVSVASSFISKAQTAEDSIKLTINKLFDGMKAGDAAMIKAAFADSAILQSVGMDRKTGKLHIENEVVNDFAEFVSKQPKGSADERIIFDVIKIDERWRWFGPHISSISMVYFPIAVLILFNWSGSAMNGRSNTLLTQEEKKGANKKNNPAKNNFAKVSQFELCKAYEIRNFGKVDSFTNKKITPLRITGS